MSLPDWSVDPTLYSNDGEIIAQITIDRVPVAGGNGILAAFVGAECRGVKTGGITNPSGKYLFILRCYSNVSSGETLTFKYYDPIPNKVFQISETVPFESNMTIGTAINPHSLNGYTDIEISRRLSSGWSWFSLNVQGSDMSTAIVLGTLEPGDGDYIKNQTVSATYYNDIGWFGELVRFDPKEMYKIKLTKADTLKYLGLPVDLAANPITIKSGWNWIGFLPQAQRPITVALSSLSPVENDYIKDQIKSSAYYNGTGWFGEMTTLDPLDGYMLKTSHDATLVYSDIFVFIAPTVTTAGISAITQTTATGGGNATSDGNATITARGVCWSTSQNPTTADSKTTDGTGTGVFISSLTGLTANSTYYVRAYATNSAGTGYGDQVSFTTSLLIFPPTLSTITISTITTTTATGGGNVTGDGGAPITARGVCWSELYDPASPNPTIANSKTINGTGTGAFISNLTGLTPNSAYFVRAYATNSAGTSYGNFVNFFTESVFLSTVSTTAISAIAQTTATGGGSVTSDGGATVTARGICWSTSFNPTTANSKTTDGGGTGTFLSNLTGLTENTSYYVRAYATNSVGTSYGSQSQL